MMMSMTQSLSMKMMIELILSQFSLHALNKCLQLLRNNLNVVVAYHTKQLSHLKYCMTSNHSVVEGDHANQSLLIQVTNLNVVEEGHPILLPPTAMSLNKKKSKVEHSSNQSHITFNTRNSLLVQQLSFGWQLTTIDTIDASFRS